MCVLCVETVQGRIVRREEEARSGTTEGRKEESKKDAQRSRMVEKDSTVVIV